MKRKERIAYHEAGHAAGGLVSMQRVYSVSIDAAGDYLGKTNFSRTRKDRASLEDRIVALFSGSAAEERALRLRGEPLDEQARNGARQDEETARGLVWKMGIPAGTTEEEACLSWLRLRAQRLIEENWDLVQALVVELLAKRQLRRKAIRDVYWNVCLGPNGSDDRE